MIQKNECVQNEKDRSSQKLGFWETKFQSICSDNTKLPGPGAGFSEGTKFHLEATEVMA
jgi:hypothetical protein